ncbi:MAG: hypothetical protein K6G75_08070 [Lachnospiraceae bacterium]|nr:hypothetical protein [Lachnospiraceae bacterium]
MLGNFSHKNATKLYMVDGIADGTIILEGEYKVLTKDDVKAILRESL